MLAVTLRGLLHGDGSDLRILRASNLWGAPEINADYHGRDAAHGVDGGIELLAGRPVWLKVRIDQATQALAQTQLRELAAAWALSSEDVELTWEDDLGSWVLFGRPQLAHPDPSLLGAGKITVDCRFLATDPIIYSAAEVTGSTGRVQEGSGFTPPFVPPFTLGESEGGTVRLANVGTAAAPWTGVLKGPLVNPVIRNVTTGAVLDFRANGGLSLAAGETVSLASTGQEVLLNGTSDRSTLLDVSSRWWLVEPGFTDFELTADSGDHADALTLASRDGWL